VDGVVRKPEVVRQLTPRDTQKPVGHKRIIAGGCAFGPLVLLVEFLLMVLSMFALNHTLLSGFAKLKQ